jgi:hypothetical protein
MDDSDAGRLGCSEIECLTPLLQRALQTGQGRAHVLQFLEQLVSALFESPGALLSRRGLAIGSVDDLVPALGGIGGHLLRVHGGIAHQILGLASRSRSESMSLTLGLAHDRQHVAFRVRPHLLRRPRRLLEHLRPGHPGITT